MGIDDVFSTGDLFLSWLSMCDVALSKRLCAVIYFLILICCRRSSARKCQMSRPLLLLHTLHPLGQPGELLPPRPHAELLLVVGVERRAGSSGGDHGLHLVRVRVGVRARVKVRVRVGVGLGLGSGSGFDPAARTSAHGTARLASSHAITMAAAPAWLGLGLGLELGLG